MIKNIFYLLIIALIFSFFYFVFIVYFSEKSIKKIYLNRININKNLTNIKDLLILKNDTNNVIEFNNGFNTNDDGREKRSFWKLIERK